MTGVKKKKKRTSKRLHAASREKRLFVDVGSLATLLRAWGRRDLEDGNQQGAELARRKDLPRKGISPGRDAPLKAT